MPSAHDTKLAVRKTTSREALIKQEDRPDRITVAFDAGFLTLPPSGIGSYARGLLGAYASMPDDVDVVTLQPGGMLKRAGTRAMRMTWDTGGVELSRLRHAAHADVLHVPAFSAPVHTSVPLVVTVHDVIPLILQEYRQSRAMRFYLEVMKRTVRRARIVLTPSEAAASDIGLVLGINPARIRVTPLAADPFLRPTEDMEQTRRALAKLNVTSPYLLSMAGFDRRKNVLLLIRAFAGAIPHLPDDVQLVLAGAPHSANPTVFPPVRPLIDELGVSERVVLTGRVSNDERRTLYQGALAYVTPSEYEGFGLSPLEAMACGVPVIAADRTSFPEVMGNAGLLVEPELAYLVETIVLVATDDGLRDRLSRTGLHRAEAFSWERTAWLTIEAYWEAVSGMT